MLDANYKRLKTTTQLIDRVLFSMSSSSSIRSGRSGYIRPAPVLPKAPSAHSDPSSQQSNDQRSPSATTEQQQQPPEPPILLNGVELDPNEVVSKYHEKMSPRIKSMEDKRAAEGIIDSVEKEKTDEKNASSSVYGMTLPSVPSVNPAEAEAVNVSPSPVVSPKSDAAMTPPSTTGNRQQPSSPVRSPTPAVRLSSIRSNDGEPITNLSSPSNTTSVQVVRTDHPNASPQPYTMNRSPISPARSPMATAPPPSPLRDQHVSSPTVVPMSPTRLNDPPLFLKLHIDEEGRSSYIPVTPRTVHSATQLPTTGTTQQSTNASTSNSDGVPKAEGTRPDYKSMPLETRKYYIFMFRDKFKKLQAVYPKYEYPDIKDHDDLDVVHNYYDNLSKRIVVESTSFRYKVAYCVLLYVMEKLAVKAFKLTKADGFTQLQVKMMCHYEMIFLQLGELSVLSFLNEWHPLLTLMACTVVTFVIYIALGYLVPSTLGDHRELIVKTLGDLLVNAGASNETNGLFEKITRGISFVESLGGGGQRPPTNSGGSTRTSRPPHSE